MTAIAGVVFVVIVLAVSNQIGGLQKENAKLLQGTKHLSRVLDDCHDGTTLTFGDGTRVVCVPVSAGATGT